jgi:uncharacterized RmlC-like cupin family protein
LDRKVAFLDRSVAPRRPHQFSLGEYLTGRGKQRLQQLQALAAHSDRPPLTQKQSALHIKNKRAKGKRRGHAWNLRAFAKIRNNSEPNSRLFGVLSTNLFASIHYQTGGSVTVLEIRSIKQDNIGILQKASVVRGGAPCRAGQGSDYEPGVSAETVGSKSIWLGMITLGAGRRTRAHVHEHHETALYMLSGDAVELWTGDQLQYRDIVQPGDYIFIPANMLHVAVNRSNQPAVFVGSRNEATAQESVVLCPEMDRKVP